MTARQRTLDRAIASERTVTERIRRELSETRRAAGLSRRELAIAVGLTESEVERFELGVDRDIGVGRTVRIATALGLDFPGRLYPAGLPVRDAAQIRLGSRLRARLHPGCRWQTEVGIAGVDDHRAWDVVVDGTGCRDGFELESRIGDVQAVHRRIRLKARDDGTIQHAFLVLAATRHTRNILAAVREDLRATLPLDTREVLAAFASGRCPGAGGVIVI